MPEKDPPAPERKPRRLITRRGLLKSFATVLASGAAAYAYGNLFEVHHAVTEHLTIHIPGLAPYWHGKRIAQLSDLHAGITDLAYLNRAFAKACDLQPEFLAVTGDFVDNNRVDPREIAAIIKPYTARVPILGITGNHDFGDHFNEHPFADRVCQALSDAGIIMLRNQIHMPRKGPGELCFVGLDDLWSGLHVAPALELAPPDASVILLDHNPDSWEYVCDHRFHLMLAGHTHGGQVRLPFLGPLILPVSHKERSQGLFHLDPAQPHRALYVNRGIGHNLKIRLNCYPELTCITLRNPDLA